MADADLRVLLETFDPKVRHDLRRILIRDQADREVDRLARRGIHRAKPQVDPWGGQDLNLRPEDYESPALTD